MPTQAQIISMIEDEDAKQDELEKQIEKRAKELREDAWELGEWSSNGGLNLETVICDNCDDLAPLIVKLLKAPSVLQMLSTTYELKEKFDGWLYTDSQFWAEKMIETESEGDKKNAKAL